MDTATLTLASRSRRRGSALSADARPFGLRRRIVRTSAGSIVVRAGEATGDTATILLHGAAGSWTTWTPLLREAARSGMPLSDVIALDLPGWGESRAPDRIDVALMSSAVRDVAEALGYRRWVLVGHSLGGFLALDLAARAPRETAAVLLISPSGPAVLRAIRQVVRGGAALPAFAGMLLTMRLLAAMRAFGAHLAHTLHRAGMLGVLTAPLFAAPARVHPSVLAALAEEVRPRAFAEAARAAATYDETIWRAIDCPVRSLRGEHDVFVADTDEACFARLIPDFAQTTVRAAGHFAAIEQPDAVRSELRRLLDAHAPRPAPAADPRVTTRAR